MRKELAKTYAPKEFEDRIYHNWEEKGYFHAEIDPKKKPYTIVIPPPNITGQLHMGHALDNTLQDILIRWRRMQGYSALWLPGTDHASIATEAKIVGKMKEEGLTKEQIGREEFLKRAWDWKRVYGGRIVQQLKKLGSSCDWERERFTLDEGCSRAVQKVFMDLYNKGLIYHGVRMINWCPNCKTSISDIVNEAGVAKGTFYLYFKDKLDIRYKLIAKKSAEVFKHAYQELQKQSIDHFEDQLIFIVDQVIGALNANPTLLKLISKHLSWGMFKNSLVEPIDDAQRNIYDIYMDLLNNSGHEFDHPEVMIYMIIEMVAGSCYNVILTGEPVSVDELKPYLYQSIRLIIRNHIL